MQITLSLQAPHQVSGACQTEADYVRMGYAYCSFVAKKIWPFEELQQSVSHVLDSGKTPQLILPFCPLEERDEEYWLNCLKLANDFPEVELVVSSWGSANLPLPNTKIASVHLNALCSQEVEMLRKVGVKVVALPLSLRDGTLIKNIINNSPQVVFEYQLDGQALANFNWFCRSDPGVKRKSNGICCKSSVKFASLSGSSIGNMVNKGNTLWLERPINTLHRVNDLLKWGISRGVIVWGEYDLELLKELISLYQVVIKKGMGVVQQDDFYKKLRERIRYHYFN